MRKIIFLLAVFCFSGAVSVQERKSQFSIIGEYEVFSDVISSSGYNIGVEFKH